MSPLITNETPIFASLELACLWCGDEITVQLQGVICKDCGVATYCSPECKEDDWTEHKTFCHIQKKLPITESERTNALNNLRNSYSISPETTLKQAIIRQYMLKNSIVFRCIQQRTLVDFDVYSSINRKREFYRLGERTPRSLFVTFHVFEKGMIPMLLTSEKLVKYINQIENEAGLVSSNQPSPSN